MDTLQKLLGYVLLFSVVYIILRYFPKSDLSEVMCIILALIITTTFVVTEKTVSFMYELINSKCNNACDTNLKKDRFENFDGRLDGVSNTKSCKVVCSDNAIEEPYTYSKSSSEPRISNNNVVVDKMEDEEEDNEKEDKRIKVKIVREDDNDPHFGSMFEDLEKEDEYGYIIIPGKSKKVRTNKFGDIDNNSELNEYGYSYLPLDKWYRHHEKHPISIVKKVKDVQPNEIGGISDCYKTWYLEKN